MVPMADIRDHIKTHCEAMPRVKGPKAFALAAPVVLDEPDVPDNSSYLLMSSQAAAAAQGGPAQQVKGSGPAGQVFVNMVQPNIFPQTEL